MTTPFGSAVAPEVKMISAVVSGVTSIGASALGSVSGHSSSCNFQIGAGGDSRGGDTSWPMRTSFADTMRLTRARKSCDDR
jgi:hypothetical protein